MKEDKRKVHTDALETLGMIIDDSAKRDAIHLAVEPVIAKEELNPGQHVTVDGRIPCALYNEAVGIVDPFLSKIVQPGDRFWLVVYPRQITSLRHVWEHPSFPISELQVNEEIEERRELRAQSKKWIEDIINKWSADINNDGYCYYVEDELTYENVMYHADCWVDSPGRSRCDFMFFNMGNYDGYWDVDGFSVEKFWHHYEIIRGKKVEEDRKTDFFSCLC